jgi:hypothetical protein
MSFQFSRSSSYSLGSSVLCVRQDLICCGAMGLYLYSSVFYSTAFLNFIFVKGQEIKKWSGRKRPWSIWKKYPSICLEWMRKTTNHLRMTDSPRFERDTAYTVASYMHFFSNPLGYQLSSSYLSIQTSAKGILYKSRSSHGVIMFLWYNIKC